MSEPRRWNLVAEGLVLAVSGGPSVSLQEAEKGIPVIEAEPVLARLKEAEEIVRWLADGGPCWSVHSRTMEPTFSHSEQATARAYLKKWEGEK